MTSLLDVLTDRIAANGPIPLPDYIAACLGDPDHGYYATRDPLGASGDFTTAPEISQMFGELIGLCLAQAWLDQGAPNRITLAELGPGRGTLMADALRATRGVPAFHDALSVHFVETSPVLRTTQAQAVPGARFHDSADTLPDEPLYLIANEFFDALPIRQFKKQGDGWSECHVSLAGDRLAPVFLPVANLPCHLNDGHAEIREGDIVEYCPALHGIVGELATRINKHGGGALIIDYGDWQGTGDTLQAVRAHEYVNPFSCPGMADLTAHVDFAAIAQAAAPVQVSNMTPQGAFLERLGITARTEALARNLTGDARRNHIAAHRRLVHPDDMGLLFKVIGLTPQGAMTLPGLTT